MTASKAPPSHPSQDPVDACAPQEADDGSLGEDFDDDFTGLEPIAIVGMAGRFPGAPDVAALWQMLRDGRQGLRPLSDAELAAAGVDRQRRETPGFVAAGGPLEDIDLFDADFFGIAPREAQLMDPQHRLFLEGCWQALEDAGYEPQRVRRSGGSIGVFAGTGENSYLINQLLPQAELIERLGGAGALFASGRDFLTTRASYKLDLTGPSLDVQTACSTSLVAVHLACQSLLAYQCDLALAGGVSVKVPQHAGYFYQEGGIRSRDGCCRPFDAQATGTVDGSGLALVVLKRLEEALAEGDTVHAVIRSTAINNDGAAKVGYTAPSVSGQASVIATALELAAVPADTISYIEAHGTGTALGDPIEIRALQQAFGADTQRRGFCALGSIKSNIGHLDAAAGATGLLKAALCLKHRQLPASLHFQAPNPGIDFAAGPFFVNTAHQPWQTTENHPRRAGVSSFGLGGTNAHAVLEEAPPRPPSGPSRPVQLLVLSARSHTALEAAGKALVHHLEAPPSEGDPDSWLADVAHTLRLGRRAFAHRRIAVGRDLQEAREALTGSAPSRLFERATGGEERRAAFLFPGQGAQSPGRGADLYRKEATFRRWIDAGAAVLTPSLGVDPRPLLFTPGAPAAAALRPTHIAQPTLFLLEYALARLWMSWGIEPAAMLGHSLGEYVAACLAEVFSFEDALTLVAARGRLMGELPPGAMLAVPLPLSELEPRLEDSLAIAARNGPRQTVLSGPTEAVQAFAAGLTAEGVKSRRLETSHAFHSAMMEPVLEAFAAEVEARGPQTPKRPFVSNLTGTWIRDQEATNPQYWSRHLRHPVRFAEGVATLLANDEPILLEVGPGNGLSKLARSHPAAARLPILTSLPPAEDDEQLTVLTTLGRLWLHGVEADWQAFAGDERRHRVPLPTYPFERKRFWIDRPPQQATSQPATPMPAAETRKAASLLHRASWQRTPLPTSGGKPSPRRWLLLLDDLGLGQALAEHLRQAGQQVWTATTAQLDPQDGEGCQRFLQGLTAPPDGVVHLWNVEGEGRARPFDSLLHLARALAENAPGHSVELTVVSHGLHRIEEDDPVIPERSLLLGPCRVIPLELPTIRCRSVDLDAPIDSDSAATVLAEIETAIAHPTVAWRGGARFTPTWEGIDLHQLPPCAKGGWLITGGLGGIGLEIAHHLAGSAAVHLTLVTRTSLPALEERSALLAAPSTPTSLARKLRRLAELEARGAEVVVEVADVADQEAMAAVIDRARQRTPLVGVVHAAGVAGGGLLEARDLAQAEQVLAPKVEGTRVLDRLLADTPLDTFLLCSSLGAVLGNTGQVDYCAANAFQDAWATSVHGKRPWRRVVAVAWDAWREVGMAVDKEKSAALEALHHSSLTAGLSTAEGLEIFDLARTAGPAHLVVSSRDLAAEIARRQAPQSNHQDEHSRAPAGYHPRPPLDTPYAAPQGQLEERLCQLWEELLGVTPVGRHDDFSELGGHSLLATEIMARVRRRYGVHLALRTLLEGPTVAQLAVAVTVAVTDEVAVSSAQQEDAEHRPGAEDLELPPLVEDLEQRHDPFPLTAVQEAYWVGRRGGFELGNVSMHGYIEAEIPGLDVERYTRAWRRLVERHDMLRAVVDRDGRQRILRHVPPLEIQVTDLRPLRPTEVEDHLRRQRQEMSHQVLPTERWPLFDLRASLLAEVCRLHLSFDGIMMDGWSWQVLARDLDRLYANPDLDLPPLQLSFRDYVLAVEALRDSPQSRRSRAYWMARLPTLPPAPTLPLARDPKDLEAPQFSRRGFELEPALWQRVKGRAAAHGLTPSALVAAAWSEVLAAWSEEPCFTLNLTLFNRRPLHPQVGDLLGDFTALTLLAVEPPAGTDFAGRARALQERLWDDLDHRDFEGMEVLRELARRRGGGTRAVMPVVLTSLLPIGQTPRAVAAEAQEEEPSSENNPAGRLVYSISQTPQVWIDHQVRELLGQGVFTCDAVDELFPAGLLDDLLDTYHRLLSALADEATWRSRHPLELPPAHQQLHDALAGPKQQVAGHRLLQDGFFHWAEEQPEAAALLTAERIFTYAQLATAALQLAAGLRRQGVQRGDLVAVVMEKGWQQAVAILAILEAGAAYLPIDATLPHARRHHLLARGQVRLALTQEHLHGSLPWPATVTPLAVGEDLFTEAKGAPRQATADTNDLAYVIFTSGSTGEPKGVTLAHGNALTTLDDIQGRVALSSQDRVLALSSLSFDLSVFDLFGIWNAGGGAVLPAADAGRDPARWLQDLSRHRVTLWNSVPALFEMLIEHLEGRRQQLPPDLRAVLLSGDWIPVSLPRRAAQRAGAGAAPGPRLFSLGGATEGAVWSIVHEIHQAQEDRPSIPYGRALSGQNFHVLNRNLAPCPLWVPGDLYISGGGIALGYWRDSARTASSFLPHPRGTAGARLYRTGDRGRLRPDGEIEFLGRTDAQVQIQGYRVELGEVEARLLEHPAVQAVAATPILAGGDRQTCTGLVAHVVCEERQPTAEELHQHLAGRLPSYMLPSRFTFPSTLPLTTNGKVDRKALGQEMEVGRSAESRPPEEVEQDLPSSSALPLAEVTQRVADVLSRPAVDPDAAFLDLGASSIDMVRLANALEDTFGHRPSLDQLFQLATARAVAAFYRDHQAIPASPAPPTQSTTASLALLRDPQEREDFKQSRPGLRRRPGTAPAIALGEPGPEANWWARRSHRRFAPTPLALHHLGGLLSQLAQRPLSTSTPTKARYGSAGALYPVRLYLYVKPHRVDGLGAGTYYYHPAENHLLPLAQGPAARLQREHHDLTNREIFDQAAFAIFLVARLAAITPLYGPYSRDFCLVEAGLISQLLESEAPNHRIGLCSIGRLDEDAVKPLLDLPPDEECPLLYSLLGGPVDEPPTTQASRTQTTEEEANQPFPLTDMQEAYWLGQNPGFELAGMVAHIYQELELEGLDLERFDRAWNRVIARHDTLRTVLTTTGQQQILPSVPTWHSPRLDLQNTLSAEAERALDTVARQMQEQGPTTDSWPLFELRHSMLPERRVRLHLSLSLLICDALSVAHLWRDLAHFYEHPQRPLAPLPYSFRQYVYDLMAARREAPWRRALDYWRARLDTLPPPPDLPLARDPATLPGGALVRLHGHLEAPQWQRLARRARSAGLTPAALLATVYAQVLATWSAVSHFTLNLLFFDRRPFHPAVGEVVGNFSSPLLLEVDANPQHPFLHRARALQHQLLHDLEHSQVTGIEVLRELHRVQGGVRRTMPVVFVSSLDLVNWDTPGATAPAPGEETDGEETSPVRGRRLRSALQTPYVWLDHQVFEERGGLGFHWDVARDLFPQGLPEAMCQAFAALLRQLAEDDVWQETAHLPTALPAPQLQILAQRNSTMAPIPPRLLHAGFLERAQENPANPAVFPPHDAPLTYSELEIRSRRLAHELRHAGAQAGTLVAVVMESGWQQAVAVLAILRAGAAYLPLDATLPSQRLHHLLRRGEARLALTQKRWLENLEWPPGIEVLAVERGPLPTPPALEEVARPADLAYVIFTSGSTGEPKGVMLTHGAAWNTLADINHRFAVGAEDRILALSSLSFDLSVYDLFGLWAAGGAVVLPSTSQAGGRDPEHWLTEMTTHRVSLWNSVPALLELLVEHLEARAGRPGAPSAVPESLRTVLLSGDWIPLNLAPRLRALATHKPQIISLGGATEAAVWSVCHPILEIDPSWVSIPYGKPLANQQLHVLDENLEPRPCHVPGELYIAGDGLAEGYWRAPEQSAAFFHHPRSGERLYRTGDLARTLSDGTLEFLGRRDGQVKIQGYRVEVGEVEAALLQHPAVAQAAVTPVEAGAAAGYRALAAHLVCHPERPSVETLQQALAERLPAYMVPASYYFLDALPLSANGKIDRRALRRSTATNNLAAEPTGRVHEDLQDDLERTLAEIWQDLLERPVGRNDNFFDLGGYSLLAVRLVARIEKVLGQRVSIAQILAGEGTIAALADELRKAPPTAQ